MNADAGKPLNWKRNLAFVSIAQFFATTGFGFALPFIPFYIRDGLGVTVDAELSLCVGLFTASGHLALVLSSPIWGFIGDIYGRRIMVLRTNFCSALLMPLMVVAPTVGWLVFLRFMVGAFAGSVSASQSLIASNTPSEHMGFAMGTISSAVGSGNLVGFVLGALIVQYFSYTAGFISSGIMLAVAGVLTLFGVRENFTRTTTLREALRQTGHFKLPRFGGVWMLLGLMAASAYVSAFERPFVPQMTEIIVGTADAKIWASIVLSGSAIAGIIAGGVMGQLADRFTPQKVGFAATILAAIATVPMALATTIGVFAGTRTAMSFFAAGLDPVFQVWLAKCAPANKRSLFLGWGTSFRALGWFACALTAGGVAMLGGVRMVFFVTAGLFLLLAPVIAFASRRLASLAAVAGSSVHPAPPTTLDPHGHSAA